MKKLKKFQEISSQDIVQILNENYLSLMPNFYAMQSSLLSGIYKRYKSIETANIILCFAKSMHLEIIRQREKNLNFNTSLENFWKNFNEVNKPTEKIKSIVNNTAIPKETVRRKIKNLLSEGFLLVNNTGKGYIWNFLLKEKDPYFNHMNDQIRVLSKFISKLLNLLNINLSMKIIEKEIQLQFSFYWYHFLSCQLEWLKMWQQKLKDNELLLILLQVTIPTLQAAEKNIEKTKLDDVLNFIESTEKKNNFSKNPVGATTVAEVTGIPRATCIRKLNKLVLLGFLLRETKTKRYFVNQNISDKTKNIAARDNVNQTIEIFGQYLSITLNSLIRNRK